ncbi:MAG TPA: SPASM domain-containing protein [Bdellovibrionota bacterium]|jgi:hypothetical protein
MRSEKINLAYPGGGFAELRGFDGIEHDAIDAWRWALGNAQSIAFQSRAGRPLRFYYRIRFPFLDARLTVRLEGRAVLELRPAYPDHCFDGHFDFTPTSGAVVLEFESIPTAQPHGDPRALCFVLEHLVAVPDPLWNPAAYWDVREFAREGVAPYCTHPFERMRVTAEGKVYSCCFQKSAPLGDLTEDTVEQAWASPAMQAVRRGVADGGIPAPCQGGPCPYSRRNDLAPALLATPRAWPRFLDVDLPNTHCNIGGARPSEAAPACIMCDRSRFDYVFEQDRLSEVLPKIRPLLPHLHRLHVQGTAEPFWKDAIFDVLDGLEYDPRKHPCLVSTYTNGTVFTPDRQKMFFDRCGRVDVTFSLDAATQTTYSAIRRLPAFERVLGNIRAFARQRDPRRHAFRIAHNINLLNISEVVPMVHMGADLGIDEMEFSTTEGVEGICISRDSRDEFRRAQDSIQNESLKLGLKAIFLREFAC